MRNESDFDINWLPIYLQELIEQELQSDETIVWMDQPNPKRFMLKALPIILFAIPWTAFSIFWMAGASGFKIPDFSKPESFFMLFGLPFLFIGIGMLSTPLWIARNAKKTVYLLTDQRAIIFDGGWSTTIRFFKPDQLINISRKQRRNGTGDLIFVIQFTYNNQDNQRVKEIGFIGIDDVKMVHDLIEKLVDQNRYNQS